MTLKDIAKVAGVSAQTVSSVVNNTGSVSEAVRARIREIADNLGYSPNMYAKAMRTGRSRTIALVIGDIRRPFFPELAHEIQRVTRNEGYSTLIVDTDETPNVAERIGALRSLGIDGVISTEEIPSLYDLRLPTVMLTDASNGLDSVTADDLAGGTMIAEHLLSLGHRKIALLTSPLTGCIQARRKGLLNRLKGEAEIVWEVTTSAKETITQQVRDKIRERDVTAIVCSHDLMAIGLLQVLREERVAVPQDVSVVGFDDVQWASIVTPSLTTVRQPYAELANHAVGLLLARIDKPRRRARRVKLEVELVERESVGKAPNRALARPIRAQRRVLQPVRA
ncbi:MAG: LacI family DNA-binding transcriptional regulator [Devosia sp.]